MDGSLVTGYDQPMKVARRLLKKSRVNFQGESFSLSHAKTYLGRLMEKAAKGETVYIMRGPRRFLLQEVPPIDPIPVRPPGYFAGCYSKSEIEEQNYFAKASLVRTPKDLE
jgi:hypothetical protein